MESQGFNTKFTVTMTGALLVFLGAAMLANTGDITEFFVRLIGSACAVFGVMIFAGNLLKASSVDAVPFEELLDAGALLLAGLLLALFPALAAKVLVSVLGVLIALSGCGDLIRARRLLADDDQVQRMTLRIGIATVAAGLFVAALPSAVVHGLPIVCGVALVLDGLSELYIALTM